MFFYYLYGCFSSTSSVSGTKTEQLAPKNTGNGTKDELDDGELVIYIGNSKSDKKAGQKKNKRKQGIIKLVKENPSISIQEMADKLDSSVRTIKGTLKSLMKSWSVKGQVTVVDGFWNQKIRDDDIYSSSNKKVYRVVCHFKSILSRYPLHQKDSHCFWTCSCYAWLYVL